MNKIKVILAWILRKMLPPQRTSKKIIEAVHEDDIEKILEKLGLLESLKNGKLRCEYCECIINEKNIQSLFSHNGRIGFCCENILCYEKLKDKTESE